MAEGLRVVTDLGCGSHLPCVPSGAIGIVGEPMAFIAAESVLGDDMTDSKTATVHFNTGHQARLYRWPCECNGVVCAPDESYVLEGTRLLVLPAGTRFDALTPEDMP